jgi:hypothetical protein
MKKNAEYPRGQSTGEGSLAQQAACDPARHTPPKGAECRDKIKDAGYRAANENCEQYLLFLSGLGGRS